jgi:hypothetical protein
VICNVCRTSFSGFISSIHVLDLAPGSCQSLIYMLQFSKGYWFVVIYNVSHVSGEIVLNHIFRSSNGAVHNWKVKYLPNADFAQKTGHRVLLCSHYVNS